MPRIKYQDFNLSAPSLETIAQANAICAEYQEQGYDLTLRQLYYVFVSRNLIPNKMREYDRLGRLVSQARLAGLMDWNYIVDRTRSLKSISHWATPASVVDSAAYSYRRDKWVGQPYRVEVWVEKEALAGVVGKAADAEDVPYFSCRGYGSVSEMWVAGQRLKGYARNGQTPLIIHLGDHDPSGIDMTRDIDDRLTMFMGGVEVKRIALNMDQVERYNPPPNPAKESDSRWGGYVQEYGYESWELDALEPRVLDNLIRRTIRDYRDDSLYNALAKQEAEERAYLEMVSRNWESIVEDYITPTYGAPEIEVEDEELEEEDEDE